MTGPGLSTGTSLYGRLLGLLDTSGVRYEVLAHPAEGRTDRASRLRGHPLPAAAKSMVVTVSGDGRPDSHVIAVVPGDRRVDLARVARLCGGRKARFTGRARAEELAGSVSGSIIPFSLDGSLDVLADPVLLREPVLYFNAARLDLSVALHTDDYRALAGPTVAPITE
ncbi:YbaK/prolyl-tRNA synthetase associated domain-containing protein [Streptomyces sp. 130]|uniref:YbaK/EbsC family protein n=1 Tax=Streptomyces sp. 130 TaxID=2591006 RepID=UPI00117CFBB8|nr:YbaK/EbsC family protein [Streptomyces sp. 130]TRV73031.1 YbaK/prolyl-tRNA synthetase associated domain-containing protein [Streptomyces sp. 130]